MSEKHPASSDPDLAATDRPSGGGINEDWAATIVGLGLLALALFGLIPEAVLW
ncbi:MAG TPA: hypothetical protein PKE27_20600 [Povalibacter sp.]|uniref:hypothetical protein n=1 Tax=Povalibacter sp. TaxID=1962978 RepID=UPI002C63B947|nr:hypothetical protein [Povalibacter sp.]HMN46989.1 hypothetical protein [Povalibacter sp.]